MFIIPCKYNPKCLVEKTIESIRNHHPNTEIVLVDSDSDDKTYFKRIEQYNVLIEDIANHNYEPGAFWYTVQKYNRGKYILCQDSIIFKRNIDDIIDGTMSMKCFMNFIENSFSHWMRGVSVPDYLNGVNKMMGDFEPLSMTTNETFAGVFGSNLIVSGFITELMMTRNLHKSLLPTNKFEHQIAERVFGLVAKRMGIPLENHTIIGNFHELFQRSFNAETETMSTYILDKTWISAYRS
jgi:glycosyltransferase involved in cell wall biosynthesis